jgi:hypothetical protein
MFVKKDVTAVYVTGRYPQVVRASSGLSMHFCRALGCSVERQIDSGLLFRNYQIDITLHFYVLLFIACLMMLSVAETRVISK